ncbi:hypothetical protein KIPB_009339, partial [Kipferlia bialata]
YLSFLKVLDAYYVKELLEVSISRPGEFLTRETHQYVFDGVTRWVNSATFLKMGPFMKIYKTYTNKFDTAVCTLRQDIDTKPELAALLQRMCAREDSHNQDVYSLLIMPVQRIPRYLMLLDTVAKYTPEGAEGRESLLKAVEGIKEVADDVNTAITDHKNREEIRNIQAKLFRCPPLVEPHRTFVRQGTLKKLCRKRAKVREFFLFNDCILYATGNQMTNLYAFHNLLPLTHASAVPSASATCTFTLSTTKKSFHLIAESQEDRDSWCETITALVSELDQLESVQRAKSIEGGEATQAAVWEPDSKSPNCPMCDKKFGMLCRRHHCR